MTKAAIKASINVSDEGADAFAGGPFWSSAISLAMSLGDGTAAGKADLSYIAERTVAASTDDDIDLIGSLSTALGDAFDAAEIVGLLIWNKPKDPAAVNTSDLTIDGTVTNGWTGFLNSAGTIGPIKPNGFLFIAADDAAGIGAVTAGTGDLLRISNGAGAQAKYQIAILGRTA